MQFTWFCVAGYSFAIGCVVLAASILLMLCSKGRLCTLLGTITILIGLTLLGLSGMSFPLIVYVAVFALFAVWLAGSWYIRKRSTRLFRIYGVVNLLTLTTLLILFSNRVASPAFPTEVQNICVVGDSISAGIGGPAEKTWPVVLSQNSGIEVLNLAVPGATVNSALHQQVPKVPSDRQLVLLEIGGNDIIGSTPVKAFRNDLDLILIELKSKGHQVAMFELPIFPWQWSYSRAQRELAAQHEAILIPKRIMVSVFSGKDTTSDLAHLTEKGHQQMAETVQDLLTNRKP